MARYTGPSCKLCRRENTKLYLKGERCFKDKCSFEKRSYPPGQHGKATKKISDYGLQLREKQKVKRLYGVLETQFRRYFQIATRMSGITGENLIQLLERRLDNVIYRSGFAASRKEARQIVRHNHVSVDGRRVNIPSFSVKPDQVVEVLEKSRNIERVVDSINNSKGRTVPAWLSANADNFRTVINRIPERSDVTYEIQESLIVELYSK